MAHPSSNASHPAAGFSLPDLLVSVMVLMAVMGTVTSLLLHMTNSHRMVWNRTEMHSAVRGATELLQQEVGQAGLVALPGTVTLSTGVGAGGQTVGVSATAGLFAGEQLTIDAGAKQETVTLTAVDTDAGQITATFAGSHDAGAAFTAVGGFASGIVPTTTTDGSTGDVLKLFGDVNSDGNMVYVEYTCDTVGHKLYRNVMPWNAAAKPALSTAVVLLSNIMPNDNGTPCFTYQSAVVGANTYVTDVAITLTVQTQDIDPITRQYQKETKTLLNVSPRNVFNVWELASLGEVNRIQPMPSSVQALLK
jgi:Tfp pilus assembly protein PilW